MAYTDIRGSGGGTAPTTGTVGTAKVARANKANSIAYQPALEVASQQRAGLESELRAAIEQQQFTLALK